MESQETIINAALECFGAKGYRKASMADIVDGAGVSKAILFHHFGTKKRLYLSLVEHCTKTLTEALRAGIDKSVTDFFGRIQELTRIEIAVLRRRPSLLAFLKSAYFETSEDVQNELQDYVSPEKMGEVGNFFRLESMDLSHFRDDVDPGFVLEVLTNYVDGLLAGKVKSRSQDFDAIVADFDRCIELFKKHFYKETT